jgi:hypothetical protein
MANSVDTIIGSEAIKQVESLIAKLSIADAELIKISQSATTASKGISSISTPSGLGKAVDDTSKLNTELDRQNNIIKALEIEIKKLSYARQSNNKQSAEEAVNQRVLNQNAIAQAKATSNLVGSYQKLDLEHKKAFKNAQDLGVQYGVTSDKFLKASQTANELDKKLKDVDSSLGKNNRNVGNYASGFNGLGNSINQITRELPAFTFSAQTGFLALSNNIPILTDEIGKLVARNKELKASGQETTSVFKQILGGVFSLQTVMGIAILGFTLFGDKIVDFITGAEKSKKVLEAEKKAIEDRSKAMDDARTTLANYQGDEISRSKILLETAKNLSLSYKEREKAVKELQERYPEYLGGLSKEKILAGETADAEELLNTALVKRGVALAAQQEIQKVISDSLKNEKKLADELLNIETKRKEINSKLGSGDVFAKEGSESKKMADERNLQLSRLFYLEQTINEQYSTRKSTIQESLKFYLDQYNQNAKFLDVVKETNTITKKSKEEEALKGTEKWYNQQISKLKEVQTATADTTEEYKSFTKQIEALEKALELLRNGNKFAKPSIGDTSGEAIPSTTINTKGDADPNDWMKQYAEDIENAKKETEALKKATDNFLSSFSSEFLQNSGMGSLETFFDGTFDKLLKGAETTKEKFAVTFNAIAESAQEAFNFISNASQANFEAENARIQSQYETALKFAGGSTVAESKLREDLEKKKKEISNRENKAKQKQALFNIAIDTAQGVVSALASTPPNIPLSIAIGVLGAVQLGLVASQKVPQYFDGTDNHTGGLMLVNDGKGANYQEKIILPNGKEIMPDGRNVLMNAPAGTKVLTHEQQIAQMLNERGISMSANFAKSNGMTAQEMDNVLTKHFANIQTNHTSIDENGFRSWSNKNGNKTVNSNNRVQRIGIKV